MKKRILLVEDVEATRKAYRRFLEGEGFEVREAANVPEALALLEAIAFHVVCIDLGLDAEDGSNYEGRKVVAALPDFEAGSRAVIVSQRDDGRAFEIAIEGYETRRITKYLRKGHFTPEEFLSAISNEAELAELGIYGTYRRIIDALLHGLDEDLFVDRMLRVLEPRGGYGSLISLVDAIMKDFVPIRPHKDRDSRVLIDETDRLVKFELWSKALGKAVLASFSREVVPSGATALSQENGVTRETIGNTVGEVRRGEADRGDFLS